MDLMIAAEKLEFLAKISNNQQELEALKLGAEALRQKAGYPPNLPGYVTICKKTVSRLGLVHRFCQTCDGFHPEAACYIAKKTLDVLKTIVFENVPVVTYGPRKYDGREETYVFGLPVIMGSKEDLKNKIYIVSKVKEKAA